MITFPAKVNQVKDTNKLCPKCEDALPRLCESYSASGRGYWDDDEGDGRGTSLPPTSFDGPRHHDKPYWSWSLSDLELSMRTCEACSFLRDVIRTDQELSNEAIGPKDKVVLLSQYIGSLHHGRNQYDRCYRLKLQIFRKELDKWGDLTGGPYAVLFPFTRYIDGSEDVEKTKVFHCRLVEEMANVRLIQHWFHQCRTSHGVPKPGHQSCQSDLDPLPRNINFRVIDVKKRCVEDGSNIIAYAALSYVWGSARRLLFTESNRPRMVTEGGLSDNHDDIPQTFKDAMRVAELLGIRYVWIDALCIQQDNEQDLTSRMASMKAIYGSAALTIVSNTESVNTGIPGVGYPRQSSQTVFTSPHMSLINARPTSNARLRIPLGKAEAGHCKKKSFQNAC